MIQRLSQSQLSLLENQWKLRQQHDQNFPMEGKPLQDKYYHQKEKKTKRAGLLESQSGIQV